MSAADSVGDLFAGEVLDVAPQLLGARLHSTIGGHRVVVELTEVEAYAGSQDPGSHAFGGRTPRTEVMFGPAGHAYVYFTYGMHWCLNVVTGPEGLASAVLLRAGRLVEGADVARARRPAARQDRDLARGPARLASCLGVTGQWNGHRLDRAPLWLQLPARPVDPHRLRQGPRVGVSGPGGDGDRFPWRFWLADETSVSAYRAAVPRPPRARPRST